jgi:hypothetical protein
MNKTETQLKAHQDSIQHLLGRKVKLNAPQVEVIERGHKTIIDTADKELTILNFENGKYSLFMGKPEQGGFLFYATEQDFTFL